MTSGTMEVEKQEGRAVITIVDGQGNSIQIKLTEEQGMSLVGKVMKAFGKEMVIDINAQAGPHENGP